MGSNVGKTRSSSSGVERQQTTCSSPRGGQLDVHSQTDARDQFVALATGVIVGRCGAHSALRALTPHQVSQFGRDWVVHPSLHVSLDLGIRLSRGHDSVRVVFAVSPTLGLVNHPVVVQLYGRFHGWVGPVSAGHGFALMTLREEGDCLEDSLCVVERPWRGVNPLRACEGVVQWANSRRWLATVSYVSHVGYQMELWNFDRVEIAVVPKGDEAIPFPREVARMQFARHAADSLLISKGDGKIQVIDMAATWEQKRIVATREFGPFYNLVNPMCWNGMTYMVTDRTEGSIVCLTTGERFEFSGCISLSFIGGPYFVVKRTTDGCDISEVHSVVEQTRVFCSHSAERFGTIQVGQEVVAREPGGFTNPNDIERYYVLLVS
ncbi:hypothetical protein Pelo_9312 [Pelomyxa schiedti]|nr:hypothetical protein Pelo_9312 [Pelomyxa schiedti]